MLVFERSARVWASHDVYIVWIWQVVIMENINNMLSSALAVFNWYILPVHSPPLVRWTVLNFDSSQVLFQSEETEAKNITDISTLDKFYWPPVSSSQTLRSSAAQVCRGPLKQPYWSCFRFNSVKVSQFCIFNPEECAVCVSLRSDNVMLILKTWNSLNRSCLFATIHPKTETTCSPLGLNSIFEILPYHWLRTLL